ncbi:MULTISPECIES: hypothetical protein [unclassified Streptomyces]|uniref:hypothetical protein n=1 Tax=unclassified Streptomyces TaxID=2593676 RepID=UPI000F456C37|nr:hypothetical protein [Streptomyces sp. I6]RNL72709.1 hypothetical protein EBF04_20395 [Streptomyces sp. I6]
MSKSLAEIEIGRLDWTAFRTLGDRTEKVPGALLRLFAAGTEDEAMAAYWELENVVVVQGQLYSAALPTVHVLLAALLDELSADARDLVLELLFQIVSGEADEEERGMGNSALGDLCRDAAREGLWLVYRELGTRRRETAESILERIEGDEARLTAFLASLRGK